MTFGLISNTHILILQSLITDPERVFFKLTRLFMFNIVLYYLIKNTVILLKKKITKVNL